jgi:hypothetical protein
MTKHIATALFVAVLGACIFAGPAAAAPVCRGGEMKMADGTCFPNSRLAASNRFLSVHETQVLINGFAYPNPVGQDGTFMKGWEAERFNYTQRGQFSTNPNPVSP